MEKWKQRRGHISHSSRKRLIPNRTEQVKNSESLELRMLGAMPTCWCCDSEGHHDFCTCLTGVHCHHGMKKCCWWNNNEKKIWKSLFFQLLILSKMPYIIYVVVNTDPPVKKKCGKLRISKVDIKEWAPIGKPIA